jgi:hypothetical protein
MPVLSSVCDDSARGTNDEANARTGIASHDRH